jgi:hypothetical protein
VLVLVQAQLVQRVLCLEWALQLVQAQLVQRVLPRMLLRVLLSTLLLMLPLLLPFLLLFSSALLLPALQQQPLPLPYPLHRLLPSWPWSLPLRLQLLLHQRQCCVTRAGHHQHCHQCRHQCCHQRCHQCGLQPQPH